MKNKPFRHKETNIFKFIPFSERIANVKIDVVHQIKHVYELEQDETTYFYQAYEKWVALNCSQGFGDFKQDITRDIRTLPQLLARKQELVDILLHHLSQKNPLNLQALLEFLVALAKDMRQEFYPHFFTFYPLLTSLLNVKDTEQLEWVFQCLAYLYKFLWRYLLNNLNEVFDVILPLLHESKPVYIRNFAAQSFAFLARKVKDESKLIKLIVRPLKEKPHAIEGCGRLLFEIIRGIPGHFHSRGSKILNSGITCLKDTSYPHTILCDILSSNLTHLLPFISLSEVPVLWTILQNSLESFHHECKTNPSDRNITNLEQILFMIQKSIQFKNCSLLTEPNSLIIILLKLLEPHNQIKSHLTDRILLIFSNLLLSSKSLPQELSSRIVIETMMYLGEDDLFTFALRILNYSGFDGIVLPRLLSFCLERSTPSNVLPVLAKIILDKAPPANDVRQLIIWQPYSLNFTPLKKVDPATFTQHYLEILSKKNVDDLLHKFEECILVLYVLPHILPLKKEDATLAIKNLIELICKSEFPEKNWTKQSDKLLFLFSVALESLIYMKPDICVTKLLPPNKILPILLKNATPEYIFMLRSLDFYISVDELNEMVENTEEVKNYVIPLLLSPFEKVRLHATHIIYEIEKVIGGNEITASVFENCWLSECIPVTLQEYREKLKLLQKLDCSIESYGKAVTDNIINGKIPLSYLFGVLFLNFKLIWDPVSKIILSYGSALTPAAFWEVFSCQLSNVIQVIRESKETRNVLIEFNCEHLSNEFMRLNLFNEKPDFINYRIMMWNIMKELPDVYEYKSKDIVIHFLSFLEHEYNKRFSEAANSWNIKQLPYPNETMDMTMDIDQSNINNEEEMEIGIKNTEGKLNASQEKNEVEMEIDIQVTEGKLDASQEKSENETLKVMDDIKPLDGDATDGEATKNKINEEDDVKQKFAEDKVPETDWKSKWITKSLLAYMSIFGKFRSPKSLYKEPELNKIFLDFLSSRVADIQRSALDFILSYKLKHLTPYKEHLYGLIDDKTFKNELSLFRIDTESDLVRPEHRPHLIPIVLRIVHSKMYCKVSASRKEPRHARKAAILRFLSGCTSEELSNFITMAFTQFLGLVKDSCEEMVSEIMDGINFEDCIPPRKLFTSANLLNIIIAHCGGLMNDEQISLLLKLILIIASYPPVILSKREEVHPAYIKVIKNVRTSIFSTMCRFFVIYDKHIWSDDETSAFFKVIIWPYLKLLTSEGVNSPTAQMKLFLMWSNHQRYFNLLDKEDVNSNSPLSTVIDLWAVPKLHLSVHNTIIELLHNLIDPNVEEDEDGVKGTDLLSPHMPKILQVLQNRLGSRKTLSKKELGVLALATSSAKDNISSETLLSLVLPSLLKPSKKSDEEILDLLKTVGNVIIKANEPYKFLKQLIVLFSMPLTPGQRKLLLSTVTEVAEHLRISLDNAVLLDLYAWDPKWVEQPDFEKRLNAYSVIDKYEDNFNPLMAVIVIRTSFLYLKEEKDLSLKESARHCLRTFSPKACLCYQENKEEISFLLDETIFPLFMTGLSDQSEAFRQECISFLGFLVRGCSAVHPVLLELSPFSNKMDLEVDFFENLVHLQLHRRVRAMLRFSECLEKCERPPHSRTLINFGIPMISQFLLSPKYADKNTIIDSAIKALGSICHSLSWRYYNNILRSYLQKLQSGTDFQKQVIRIVSEILNAFHFNLTQADELEDKNSPLTSNEEKILNDKEELETKETEDEGVVLEGDNEIVENLEKETMKDKAIGRSAANKIIHELAKVILPNLQKLLADRSNSDSFHKVNKRMAYADKDEEDMLRIPLAIAIVKLLQKLPSQKLLEKNLPGLFLKLTNYLKSRSESVRKCARLTLETIMASLGPKYLPQLLSELSSLLTRGFHVHVLAYTVHGVLAVLKPLFSKGDIDPCISKILAVCSSDLFGDVSEEKEVTQIVSKTIEAKANRSYNIFHILGTYASEKYLLDLVFPLKEELTKSVSHKVIKKAIDCLQQIALGLTENEYLSPESLLELAYGLATESIPSLKVKEQEKRDAKQIEFEARRDPDAYLIPNEPKQKKALMTMECAKTNAHILVEFGLKLMYFLLKREKLTKAHFKPMLEPLVKLLIDCLDSKHVKVSTLALKCFSWVLKMDLESANKNIQEINTIFLEILHKYAAAGLSKGDNFDLVMAAFKAVSVLVRSVKSWKPNLNDRRVLLLYCEQDIDDRERQATAFSLLKALIQKGIDATELNSVMKKIANVSITSPIDSVRVQARQVMLTYIMEYRLGKELVLTYLSFYLNQLSYETKIGRESALAMIRTLVSSFPQENLNEECGLIYVNVATRLVNEDEADCKKEAAALIVLLIQKLELNGRDKLFDVTTAWISSKKLLHRRLGMQLLGLFATAEKTDFERRMVSVLPLIVDELRSGFLKHKPGRFVLLRNIEENDIKGNGFEEDEHSSDQLAFHTLQALIKLFTLFPDVLKDNKFSEHINSACDECQMLLAHEHEWVRTLAIQVLGLILTTNQLTGSKSLALDLLSQLTPSAGEGLLIQCMKLLVHMAVMICSKENEEYSLSWLIRKVRNAVNKEVVHTPSSVVIRKMACKWGAALSLKMNRTDLTRVSIDLLTPIVKELSSTDVDLAKVAKEASGYIKGKLGQSEYNNLVSRISQNIEAKKSIRKKERSQLAVTDPEKAAKRKINKQLKKKVLKKRKIELMKSHKFKRKHKKDADIDLDDM